MGPVYLDSSGQAFSEPRVRILQLLNSCNSCNS